MNFHKIALTVLPAMAISMQLQTAAHAKSAEQILYAFHNTGDGAVPSALIRDPKGDLFGTTYSGHLAFELAGGKKGALKTIATITGFPPSSLVSDAAGNYYGTTQAGGSGAAAQLSACHPRKVAAGRKP